MRSCVNTCRVWLLASWVKLRFVAPRSGAILQNPSTQKDIFLTLVIGSAGAGLFYALAFPAPFLTGPALLVTIAALFGVQSTVPIYLRDGCLLVLGIGIGSEVTPDLIHAALAWPISLGALGVVLAATLWANAALFRRVFGFERTLASIASVPGLLSYTLALAEDKKVNVAKVSLVQTLRVLILTLIVPPMMGLFDAEELAQGTQVVEARWFVLTILITASVAVSLFLRHKGVPAAFFLAGFFVSGFGHLTELTPGAVPLPLSLAAFIGIGTLIGSRFKGVSLADLRAAIGAGAVGTLLASLIALGGGILVAEVLDMPAAALFVAFAPGGVEVMIALAVQLGVEPAFVATHHIARLLILMALVPIMLRRF